MEMSEEVFKRLYSVREAARYLGISQWAVRHLNWSSKLPCVRQGRRVLFDIYDMCVFRRSRPPIPSESGHPS
ncbi:MAG TPA: helix-turn-helix domain-containing protein, partial [Nitrospira sp.]|nr:helix-turn-helix domain-containing protein [Nitrospira sp.]